MGLFDTFGGAAYQGFNRLRSLGLPQSGQPAQSRSVSPSVSSFVNNLYPSYNPLPVQRVLSGQPIVPQGGVRGASTGGTPSPQPVAPVQPTQQPQEPGTQAPQDNRFQEEARPAPDFEQLYGSSFDKVIGDIESQIAGQQPGYEAQVKNIQQQATSAKDYQKTQKELAVSQLKGQATQAESDTEAAQNEIRRQRAEAVQGIQARYGRSSGTGAFVETYLAGHAMRDISKNRETLNYYKSRITDATTSAISEYDRNIASVDNEANSLTQQAKQQVDAVMADLRKQKNMLAIERQNRIADAWQRYQQYADEVKRRNLEYQRQQEATLRERLDRVSQVAAKAGQVYSTNTARYANDFIRLLPNLVEQKIVTPVQAQGYLNQYTGGGKLDFTKVGLAGEQTDEEKYGATADLVGP